MKTTNVWVLFLTVLMTVGATGRLRRSSLEEQQDHDETLSIKKEAQGHRALPGACSNEQCRYTRPVYEVYGSYRVDYCKTFSKDCGAAAAAKFCATRHRDGYISWTKENNIGNTVTSIGERCTQSWCDGFLQITCGKKIGGFVDPPCGWFC